VSISGDGGFLFSAQELEATNLSGADFTHVIMRDNSYDMLAFQRGPEIRSRLECRARRLQHRPLRGGVWRQRYPGQQHRRVRRDSQAAPTRSHND